MLHVAACSPHPSLQVAQLRAERRSFKPDPRFEAVVASIRRGDFGWEDYFTPLLNAIDGAVGGDTYLVANDFAPYIEMQVKSGGVKGLGCLDEVDCAVALLLCPSSKPTSHQPLDPCRTTWTRCTATQSAGTACRSPRSRARASSRPTAPSRSTRRASGSARPARCPRVLSRREPSCSPWTPHALLPETAACRVVVCYLMAAPSTAVRASAEQLCSIACGHPHCPPPAHQGCTPGPCSWSPRQSALACASVTRSGRRDLLPGSPAASCAGETTCGRVASETAGRRAAHVWPVEQLTPAHVTPAGFRVVDDLL